MHHHAVAEHLDETPSGLARRRFHHRGEACRLGRGLVVAGLFREARVTAQVDEGDRLRRPRDDSLLAQLGLHHLDDVLEGGLVDEAVEEELDRPAPELAVAASGRRSEGQHLRRCRPGVSRRLEEADVDEVALCVDDVPQALRRGPDDANQQIVVGSVRLCRSDELEKLGVVGSNLLVRRQRAGAEDRAQATARVRPRARGARRARSASPGGAGSGSGRARR